MAEHAVTTTLRFIWVPWHQVPTRNVSRMDSEAAKRRAFNLNIEYLVLWAGAEKIGFAVNE